MRGFRKGPTSLIFIACCLFAGSSYGAPFAYLVNPADSSPLAFDPFSNQVKFLDGSSDCRIGVTELATPRAILSTPAATESGRLQRTREAMNAALILQMLRAVTVLHSHPSS